MKTTRRLILLALFTLPVAAYAGGYTSTAAPTRLEMMTNGVLISGAFGDPQACSMANYVFIPKTNPSFKEIMSMALTAIASSRTMQFYVDACVPIVAHWSGNVINQSTDNLAYLY